MLNGAPGIYTSLYQQMATSPRALGAYRQFFQQLIDAEGSPVLFRCTYGQDRAGWAAFVRKLHGDPDRPSVLRSVVVL